MEITESKILTEFKAKPEKVKYKVNQLSNPDRQAKKRMMKNFGLKSGKQFHKWLKKERRESKGKGGEKQ